MDNHTAQIQNAIEYLRHGISVLEESSYLVSIQEGRDRVYARYGRSFSPEQLPTLTAEEYRSFLLFENNRHWTDMQRYGSRTTRDMEALRRALSVLVDENRPLPERYDEAVNSVIGVGRAIATAILHVVYPERYGVWNSKAEAGLKALHILPDRPRGTTEGQYYAAVNEVLLQLAAGLGIDLWSLDTLWEWMAQPDTFVQQRPDLAPPFDTIFADRAQAEWAFDFLADTVKRLGGGPDDQRFALTLPKGRNLLRLNFGNSMVVDIADGRQTFHLTALVKAMESAFSFERWSTFQGVAAAFNVYDIPPDLIRDWVPGLQAVYEQSIEELRKLFSGWGRSNLRPSHVDVIFQALFDVGKREELLSKGLSPRDIPSKEPAMSVLHSEFEPDPSNSIARQFTGFTADAFKFMTELQENNNKEWMQANRERWRNAVREPMRALFADLGPAVKSKFDSYLTRDEFEIRPSHVLAKINKNWTATPDSLYHEFFWGAFYRERFSKQTDAQLFISLYSHSLRYGFYAGHMAKSLFDNLRSRILNDLEGFYSLLERLQLIRDSEFERRPEPEVQEIVPVTNWSIS